VVTLIAGALLKGIFDALTDRRVSRRERDARQEQRQDALRLRRVEFQRATLLELQEAVFQLARFTGRAQHQDVVAYRSSGTWRKHLLTEEVNQGFLRSQISIGRLRVRVRDEHVRQLAERFTSVCADIVFTATEAESENVLRLMVLASSELHEQIGAILRKLDDEESATPQL
jgi:hypothetical protein